jgi:hypothetical protein
MTKKLPYIMLLSIFLCIGISCEEVFIPKIDKTQKEFLVVDGKISNIGDFVQIRLTKAIGFNDDEQTYDMSENAEKGAIVTISDDDGNIVTLQEMDNGYYKADNYHGHVGHTYILKIKTQDGNEYESEPETIRPQSDKVSLTIEHGDKEVLVITTNGTTIINKLIGAYIFVDVKTSENDKIYYRFNTRKITEARHIEWRGGRCITCPQTSVYCLIVGELNSKPTVSEANLNNGTREIQHFNLGFIPEAIYDENDKNIISDPPIIDGWLLSCTASRISEQEYLYYSKLSDQLNADSKIFDPLPTQLLSNIKCITDSTKVALGYFSVSSEFTIDYYMRCNQGDTRAAYHYIDPLPKDIHSTCIDSIYPPDFWQYY